MKLRRLMLSLATVLALTFAAMTATAALVTYMGLGDLVNNADKIFRGTVLSKEPGTVFAGGSEFSTVIYAVRVEQALKGDFGTEKEAEVFTITMIGNLKADTSTGNAKRLSTIDVNPDMQVGNDYVLFTTAPSAAGLSTTVGLDQGLFRIFANADGREMSVNGLNNYGIFDGPVQYDELIAAINALVNP